MDTERLDFGKKFNKNLENLKNVEWSQAMMKKSNEDKPVAWIKTNNLILYN